MLKVDSPRQLVAASILILFYSYLSLAYFAVLDARLYAKNIFNCGITFVVPIPYIILVALFIFLYCSVMKQNPRVVAYPVIAMAALLPLLYLLAELKIGMRQTNPFGGNRGIYGIYASVYFLFLMSLSSLLSGSLFRRLIREGVSIPLACDNRRAHNLIIHFPILIYLVYIVAMFFLNGFILYAALALALFFLALSFEKTSILLQKGKMLLVRITSNEKLFLITIFIIAFLIRYFWGIRLLGITGENFIIASDDGPAYDMFASILARGRLIPREDIFAVSGFGYWYFLAAIYKIFGVHSFKAMFTVQSFIGAFVPILAYLIGKKIFKTRFVPVVVSIMTSLDMTLVFLSVVIGIEAIYIPLTFLALFIAVYFLNTGTFDYKKAFLLGAAFGLAYNARPPELLLFPFVLAFLIFKKKRSYKRNMAGIIAFLFIGFILFISIQDVTNYALYGERRLLPAAAVKSFHQDVAGHTRENWMLGQMGFSPFEDFKGSISVLIQNPSAVSGLIVKGFFKRLAILYVLPNFGVFDALYLVNPGSGYFFRFPVYVQCCGYILITLGVFAAFFKGENLAGVATLFAFLVYMSIRVACFFVLNSRYRGVLMPVFILFLAYGVEVFCKKIKNVYCLQGGSF